MAFVWVVVAIAAIVAMMIGSVELFNFVVMRQRRQDSEESSEESPKEKS
jgi:hypothetical protein